jgi:hypothetical protein
MMEETSMSFQLKRIVFFFCILYFGLGCCLDNRANAQTDDLFYIFIAAISNEYGSREVSGTVLYNGNGLPGVELWLKKSGDTYNSGSVTDSQGFYKIKIDQGIEYTLLPKLLGYRFDPPSRVIPRGQYSYEHMDFTAQQQASVTIGGNVKRVVWGTQKIFTAAMKAWAEDGSLTSSVDTDAEGNYSLLVPVGWTGTVQPEGHILEFVPEKITYTGLQGNKFTEDYAVCFESNIVGLHDIPWKFPDKSSIKVEWKNVGGYEFIGKMVTLSDKQKNVGFKVGDEVWWLNKGACQYSGQVAWRDSSGGYWKQGLTVRIEGDEMLDPYGIVIGTR